MLRDCFPRFVLVPVFNHALPSIMRHREHFPAAAALTFSALSPVLRGVIDRPNFSFAALAGTPVDMSSELYLWTRRLFLEFRELELRLLLEQLKPQLPNPELSSVRTLHFLFRFSDIVQYGVSIIFQTSIDRLCLAGGVPSSRIDFRTQSHQTRDVDEGNRLNESGTLPL